MATLSGSVVGTGRAGGCRDRLRSGREVVGLEVGGVDGRIPGLGIRQFVVGVDRIDGTHVGARATVDAPSRIDVQHFGAAEIGVARRGVNAVDRAHGRAQRITAARPRDHERHRFTDPSRQGHRHRYTVEERVPRGPVDAIGAAGGQQVVAAAACSHRGSPPAAMPPAMGHPDSPHGDVVTDPHRRLYPAPWRGHHDVVVVVQTERTSIIRVQERSAVAGSDQKLWHVVKPRVVGP